jgi:hypothetical protein
MMILESLALAISSEIVMWYNLMLIEIVRTKPIYEVVICIVVILERVLRWLKSIYDCNLW